MHLHLCQKCNAAIPSGVVVNGKRRVLNRRKYCLTCSPFGQHNTIKLNGHNRKAAPLRTPREVIAQATHLYLEGCSGRQVAKRLSIPESTIFMWMKKGLLPRRSHREALHLASQLGRMNGTQWDEPNRARLRAQMLRRIAEDPNNHPNRKLAGNRQKMSYPERLVFDVLTTAGISFVHTPRIDQYYPDFVIGKRIFEVDGAYWHDPVKDAIRDARLVSLGYTVERLTAKAVIKDPHIILDRLQVFQ